MVYLLLFAEIRHYSTYPPRTLSPRRMRTLAIKATKGLHGLIDPQSLSSAFEIPVPSYGTSGRRSERAYVLLAKKPRASRAF